jgi:CDP-diacylglycerol--glycerol-3-phosphate 3-phosphatidyltransferase
VILAMNGQPFWVGVLVMMLVMTEWLDGFLARSLQAESVLGARLDTVADVTFCFSLLVAITLFYPTLIRHEATWIAVAAGSYLLSWLASWIKFRRLPSYHTWAAKGVWLVMSAGILCLLMEWTPWPFRIAMTCVVLANLEAILITVVLNQCQVNVASIWHVWGDSRGLRR